MRVRDLVWVLGCLATGVLVGWAGRVLLASPQTAQKIFEGPVVTVRIVPVEGRSDVYLTAVKADGVNRAIVQAFYYRDDPKLGRLLLSKTVTCPAFQDVDTGCDALIDLNPRAVVFVRVQLLREVLSVDVKPRPQ